MFLIINFFQFFKIINYFLKNNEFEFMWSVKSDQMKREHKQMAHI